MSAPLRVEARPAARHEVQLEEASRTSGRFTLLVLVLVAFAASALALRYLEHTLIAPRHLTGWLSSAVVGVLALRWWSTPSDHDELALLLRRHVPLSIGLASLFFVHVGLRLPLGWIETVLYLGFVGLMTSTVAGVLLLHPSRRDPARTGRWVMIHVPLLWTLFSVSVFHGAFAHLHGWLAHYFYAAT